MSPSEQLLITLYGRAGCHLCADAASLLERVAAELGFALRVVDVDTDAELLRRYDVAVPLVAAGGRELARAPIDAAALRREIHSLSTAAKGR